MMFAILQPIAQTEGVGSPGAFTLIFSKGTDVSVIETIPNLQ